VSAGFPTRIAFDAAADILARVAATALLDVEHVAPAAGLGRVLAEDVVAIGDLPAFDNSAMDGFALRASDLADAGALQPIELVLAGEQFAGSDLGLTVASGACVRITTGAPMPAGADAVVMKEEAVEAADRIAFRATARAGQHVRPAGEDVRRGDVVLQAGTPLGAAALSLAVAAGHGSVAVRRRPTVALFTTGDELRPAGAPLGPGEIHDSNRVLLQGLLLADGYQPVAWPVLADDPVRIATALADAASAFDVVVTCGGVSAGEKDHLPAWLQAQGDVHFWKVRMRPGMPLIAGRVGAAQFVGLPGNPVSVFATYLTLVRPFLDALQGRAVPRPRWSARLVHPVAKRHDRLEFLRARLLPGDDGVLRVAPDPADGSHRLRAAAAADCLLVLPEGAGEWPAGAILQVLPLSLDASG
jgi:molybdopterin molybdotransferase